MINLQKFLEELTYRIPPGEGQKHSITLGDNHLLQLTLFLGDTYCTFYLDENDMHKFELDLLDEIESLLLLDELK
jgi:hypothetical protein